jgi:hypothetical protein
VTKNLEGGGASVEIVWNEWKSSGDHKVLKKILEYCKNDVRMTALLFLYFLHFKKIYIDGEEFLYDIPTFVKYSKQLEKKVDPNSLRNQSLL